MATYDVYLMFGEGENESDIGDKIVIDILWFNHGAAILKLMNIYKNNYNWASFSVKHI